MLTDWSPLVLKAILKITLMRKISITTLFAFLFAILIISCNSAENEDNNSKNSIETSENNTVSDEQIEENEETVVKKEGATLYYCPSCGEDKTYEKEGICPACKEMDLIEII